MENVIRVRAYHFMGQRKKSPNFEIYKDEKINSSIEENEKNITFKSGDLKAVIDKDVFQMSFYRGDKKLTSSMPRGLAYVNTTEERVFMKVPEEGVFMKEELQLSVGELVYGLGERFTPLVKNGQSIDIWNEDGGTSTEQSYKTYHFIY